MDGEWGMGEKRPKIFPTEMKKFGGCKFLLHTLLLYFPNFEAVLLHKGSLDEWLGRKENRSLGSLTDPLFVKAPGLLEGGFFVYSELINPKIYVWVDRIPISPL